MRKKGKEKSTGARREHNQIRQLNQTANMNIGLVAELMDEWTRKENEALRTRLITLQEQNKSLIEQIETEEEQNTHLWRTVEAHQDQIWVLQEQRDIYRERADTLQGILDNITPRNVQRSLARELEEAWEQQQEEEMIRLARDNGGWDREEI